MESNAFTRLLPEIGRLTRVVGKRRGEHAAAIWAASEYLSDFKAGLVEYLWEEPLSNGSRLGIGRLGRVGRSPLCDELFRDSSTPPAWGFIVATAKGRIAAHLASPEVVAEIVQVLPAFLEAYEEVLKRAVGSIESLSKARELTEMAFVCPES